MFRMRFHKYRAKREERAGYSFGSKLEAALYDFLKLRESAGEISEIQVQDHVYLTEARINYIADFKVFDNVENEYVWYEAKGVELPTWRLKRKLWMYYGPGKLRIYKGYWKKPFLHEEINPKKLKGVA